MSISNGEIIKQVVRVKGTILKKGGNLKMLVLPLGWPKDLLLVKTKTKNSLFPHVFNYKNRWRHLSTWFYIWLSGVTTCKRFIFGHQVALLASVAILATSLWQVAPLILVQNLVTGKQWIKIWQPLALVTNIAQDCPTIGIVNLNWLGIFISQSHIS